MEQQEIRFGEFVRVMTVQHNEVSFNDLAPKPKVGPDGQIPPAKQEKLQVTAKDIYRILGPYTSIRFVEQAKAVIPLAIYLVAFQIIVLRQGVVDSAIIAGGLVAVMLGLMLFMEGLKLGLMPFGEAMGNSLPVKSPLPVVLFITFLLGVGVTFAEPAIGALKEAGKIVAVDRAPYLYAILNDYSGYLVLLVGGGVGVAAILGTLRFVYDWSLKPLIYASLIPVLAITAYIGLFEPQLATIIGLAWDCGAVTTGPVTVPLVLSLGIGVAASVGRGSSSLSGFGIVTLASLFPILGALILGLFISHTTSVEEIIAMANQASAGATGAVVSEWDKILEAIIGAARAIIPLVLFLLVVLKIVLREKIRNAGIITYGIILAVTGMAVFNVGLMYGLAKLGDQSGSLVPAAFTQIEAVAESPLYWTGAGILISLAFAFFLGFGATMAEPALNALGMTVQNLTNGAFRKSMLMYSVSFGVGLGITVGVSKLVFDYPLFYVLIPGYLILLVVTHFSTEEFVNVGWDSAGVTTGPVTVPLVLSMGLGFGNATKVIEGFGILSMASLFPILSVLIMGLYVKHTAKKRAKEHTEVVAASA
ncbi:MAG: DUF1538 domain-containing protein [Pseudobdellovibrionaceae bacterium]|nr:DUF1538 domain-containing protein [Bdellovibrionales bacterium]USN47856.1 MAG: DUF1538 domain-containing protein [Pseudobdellovibrionaceae bacterium]